MLNNVLTFLNSAEHWVAAVVAAVIAWIVAKLHLVANAPKTTTPVA